MLRYSNGIFTPNKIQWFWVQVSNRSFVEKTQTKAMKATHPLWQNTNRNRITYLLKCHRRHYWTAWARQIKKNQREKCFRLMSESLYSWDRIVNRTTDSTRNKKIEVQYLAKLRIIMPEDHCIECCSKCCQHTANIQR